MTSIPARYLVAAVVFSSGLLAAGCSRSVIAEVQNDCDEPLEIKLFTIWNVDGETPWLETALAPQGLFSYKARYGLETERGILRLKVSEANIPALDIVLSDGETVRLRIAKGAERLLASPLPP